MKLRAPAPITAHAQSSRSSAVQARPFALNPPTRSLLEIPVHAPVDRDSGAGEIAGVAHARAVTIGSRIYMSPAEYQPQSARGRELLAHEQVHAIQQRLGRASSDSAIAAAESEAQRLAPQIARHGWAGVHVTQPAGLVMPDALPEQDLSEDRDAIRSTLEARYPWLSKLSNRIELERELVEGIVLERRVAATNRALAKLPDPQAT